jgi:signal transduction histidine kinase
MRHAGIAWRRVSRRVAVRANGNVHQRVFWFGAVVGEAAYLAYAAAFAWRGARPQAMSHLGLAICIGALALWVHARRAERAGVRWLAGLFFAHLSVVVWLQGGLAASALWWLAILPCIALLADLRSEGALMAALFIAQVLLHYGLSHLPGRPPAYGAWLDSTSQEFAAIVGAMSVMLTFIWQSLSWQQRVQGQLELARREAVAAAEAKTRFMANMSHEIRTPLNGLVGAADLLRMSTLSDVQRAQLLALQQQSSKTVLTLVDDILDWSKLEAGRLTLEPHPVNLGHLVFQANQLFSVTAFDKGIELSCSCDPAVPARLLGDITRLRQIINNLVSNAVKFTAQGGVHIHVGLDNDSDRTVHWRPGQICRVRIEVADSGIGIAEEQRRTLFVAFSQADSTITRRYGGTGLGLAICQDLASLMRGRIEVESQLGIGSCFSLVVPLTVAEPPPQTQPGGLPSLPLRGQQSTALLVIASKGLVRHVGGLLGELGLDLDVQTALPDAERLDPTRLALLLIDAPLLPPQRGMALGWLRRVAERGIRVAVLTPLSGDSVLGPVDQVAMLYKPVRRSSLRALLLGATVSDVRDADENDSMPAPLLELGLKVLVVEDNPVNQIVVSSMLDQLHCAVVQCSNGEEALSALARGAYDVVLMDLQMPVMDGLTATRELRRREAAEGLRRTPVVAMTANTGSDGAGHPHDSDMDGYLAKPFVIRQLQQCLRSFV